MKILFNFAHNYFLTAQKINTQTAYEIGGFDKVYEFSMNDIDQEFKEKNKHILQQPRGGGYWIWKWYFAVKLLNDPTITEDDYIFYCDAGSEFVSSIDSVIEVFDREKLDVMTFRQCHMAFVWTKVDLFNITGCNEEKYTHSGTRVGGAILFKKSEFAKKFFEEMLHYSQDYRVITDSPSETGQNHPSFIEHRHDESLISVIAKKYDLYPFRNPYHTGELDDTNWTNNEYTNESFAKAVEKFGDPKGWTSYFHGGSFIQYPHVEKDDKSTYPTILNLTRRKF